MLIHFIFVYVYFRFDLYKFQISPPEALAILLIGLALATNNSFTTKTMSQIFYHIRHITYQIGDHLLTFLKNVFDIILFIIFIICMPFTFVVCGALWLYKKCIVTIIRHKVGVKVFRGIMEGTDTVWAIEDDVAKSIITILLTIKVDVIAKATICGRYNVTDLDSNRGVMEVFLSTFKNRMKVQMKLHEKLIYLKRALYGYNFWCMNYDFHMDQYVRFMDITKETRLDFDALQNIISSLSNSNLPHNNEAMWEILVSPEPFNLNRNSHGVMEAEYPIIFRVHHAIGDGVALLEFFIKTFCDSSCVLEYEREMNYMKLLYSRKAKEMKKWAVLNGLMAIIKMPSILLSLSTRKVDHNRIQSGSLSGNKLISFYSEKYENHENPRRKLINIVKDRRNHQTDTTFLEVILACVTTGFKKYFEIKHFKVPRILTAVLPVRFGDTSETNLRNSFTVVLQTMPIRDQNPETIEQNIKNVQQYTKSIHRYEYTVNYWIMSFLSGLLPSYILRHILYSKHSTMAISNLMGPSCQLTILGCTIDLLTFWLPNRGLTGVGISIFSYNGSLQMGIVADKNRVESETDLNLILDIIKKYLYDMDKY